MTVRIVTDSGSDLSPQVAEELKVAVVPLSIRFGDKEFTDRVDLTPERFYQELESADVLPETAAPSPGAFEAAFRSQIEDGASAIVSINLSEALSATAQSARTAASTIDDVLIQVVDSKSVTIGLGTLVIEAAEAAKNGASADEIVALVEDLSSRLKVFGVLDTLDNLRKGGRVGGAQALLGSMLSIKPVIDLSSGKVEEAGRQRTRKRAINWIRDVVPEGASHVVIGHGNAPDVNQLAEALGDRVDRISMIGPVVGTHGGPRVLGISYVE